MNSYCLSRTVGLLGPVGSKYISAKNGTTNFRTPDFTDDYAVHIINT
jgi:hypothetical protein